MKQLFGVYTLHPADVWSTNFEQSRAQNESEPMVFFPDASAAFRYISREAKKTSMPATQTPVGKNLDGFMQLPGVGVMFNCMAPTNVMESLQLQRIPNSFTEGYIARLSDMRVSEAMCILPETEFHKLEPVAFDNVKKALSDRYAVYQLLEQTLSHTAESFRQGFETSWIAGSPMQFVYGPNGMLAKGFATEYPQDERFFSLMKDLWSEKPGFQYMDAAESLYSTYRDVRARNLVNDKPEDVSQLRAVVAVLGRLSKIAEETGDLRMGDVLQEYGEQASLDVLNAEKSEQDHEEP